MEYRLKILKQYSAVSVNKIIYNIYTFFNCGIELGLEPGLESLEPNSSPDFKLVVLGLETNSK